MLSSSSRDSLAVRVNQRFFYGWAMLGVAALGLFASGPGQTYIFSVFLSPIGEELGISRTSISSAYALASFVAALGLPYAGRLVDRYGVRPVMLAVAVLLGLTAMAFGSVTGMVTLALGFTALRFFGQGSLMLCSASLVAQWFARRRGFALSLMGLGFSLSVAVHPPLAQWLIDQVGWRDAWLWIGVISFLLLVPAVFLIENKPESIGLAPDGQPANQEQDPLQGAEVGLTIGEAMRTSAFWIIAVSLSAFAMLVTGLFFHQVAIFERAGLSAQEAARIFPISAVTMVIALPMFGWLVDRTPTKPTFAIAMLTVSAAILAMVGVRDAATSALYGVVFGIAFAAIQAHSTYVWPRYFGRRHLGSILGTSKTITVVGASIGPLPLGIAFDLYGDYTVALITLAALPLICATGIVMMRPPRLER
ncbi:MAG: MFS transporter [Pseudomonadota bacterium]